MSKTNRMVAQIIASKNVNKDCAIARLALKQAKAGLSLLDRCLIYNNQLGIIINISNDGLKIDVLFYQLTHIISIESEVELDLKSSRFRPNFAEIYRQPDLVLVPKDSLICGLALTQQDQTVGNNRLFLFECDELPLSIRPSLHVVSNLPNDVIGNFQLLEDFNITARIASKQGYIGCYEGDLLMMLEDYISNYTKMALNNVLSCLVLPGLSGEQDKKLNTLNLAVEYCNSEYC